MDNLFRQLEDSWPRDASCAGTLSAFSRWADAEPALAAYATPACLVAAAHSRADTQAASILERLTVDAPGDPWAARTVLQALLPGLAALARRGGSLVGPAEPFVAIGDLDQFLVCTALERIACVAAETPTHRLHVVLDSTWRRLRMHAAEHRRQRRALTCLDEASAHPAPPARSDAEELATVLVDAVERALVRPFDAGLVYTTRVVGRTPAEVAAALSWRLPSLVRRRHRVERLIAADALGEPRARCGVAGGSR